MKHKIIEVLPESIAEEVGIRPGDFLLSINGKKIRDVLDYRFAVQDEELLLETARHARQAGNGSRGHVSDAAHSLEAGLASLGRPDDSCKDAAHSDLNEAYEIWEIEIEKDSDEDLGMVFTPLMDKTRRCINKCIFCFIDQQPPNMRDSLYVKDDDIRLSFLHGNYVTLTNLSDAEILRIAGYHLSPLKISVHAADSDLRKKMTGCDRADNLFRALKIFGEAGIKMHFQAVICKGVNDGEHLRRTISALRNVRGAESLAIVPAGITRHRAGLFPLEQFTAAEAKAVLAEISADGFVSASDEWYILAGEPLPPYEEYENAGFLQLDNGVGMLRLFESEFSTGCACKQPPVPSKPEVASKAKQEAKPEEKSELKREAKPESESEIKSCAIPPKNFLRIGIITGKAAENFMRGLAEKFLQHSPIEISDCAISTPDNDAAICDFASNSEFLKITVRPIQNNFFGENITVSGLLTGADIIAQLKNNLSDDLIFLPQNAFRANTEIMLDGTTRAELSDALGVPVCIGSSDGGEFFRQLCEVARDSPPQ